MNTSTWELSMTPQLVFTEWTSTSFLLELERELTEERHTEEDSATSKRSARRNLSNGSSRNLEALSFEHPTISCIHFLILRDNLYIPYIFYPLLLFNI